MMKFFALILIVSFSLACSDGGGDNDNSNSSSPTSERTPSNPNDDSDEAEDSPEPEVPSAMQFLQGREDYSIIAQLIETHGLEDLFTNAEAFTFFAPNNESFALIHESTLDAYREDAAAASELIGRHLVEQSLGSEDLQPLETLVASTGRLVSVERANDYLWIEGKPIMLKDVKVEKGVIHGIQGLVGFN